MGGGDVVRPEFPSLVEQPGVVGEERVYQTFMFLCCVSRHSSVLASSSLSMFDFDLS